MTITRRPFSAWFALVAILLHALLPYVHAAQGPAGVMTTLCSAQGNSRVVYVAVGGGEADEAPLARLSRCPLCLAGLLAPPLPLRPSASEPPPGLSHVLNAAGEGATLRSAPRFAFSARAPPMA